MEQQLIELLHAFPFGVQVGGGGGTVVQKHIYLFVQGILFPGFRNHVYLFPLSVVHPAGIVAGVSGLISILECEFIIDRTASVHSSRVKILCRPAYSQSSPSISL